MKVLVISMLKMGDFIMHQSVVEAFKQQNPEANIHYLVNDTFSHLKQIITEPMHFYPREHLKKMIKDPCYHYMTPFKSLLKLVQILNSEEFDIILNLTHNRASAHLAGMLKAKNKFGLNEINGTIVGLNSPWIRYFNQHFSERSQEDFPFHYIDILCKSLNIPNPSLPHTRRKAGKVLIQPLTGDFKKDWGLHNYSCLVRKLKKNFTELDIKVICAPFEYEKIKSHFFENDVLVLNLDELNKELAKASLLITGDTFVKHLAAKNGVQILELALGSSDPFRTGAYIKQAVIIQPKPECSPCSHAQNCKMSQHLCASMLDVDSVAKVTEVLLKQEIPNEIQFKNNLIETYITTQDSDGSWSVGTQKHHRNKQKVYHEILLTEGGQGA